MHARTPIIERDYNAVIIREGLCSPTEVMHHVVSEAMQLGHRLALEGKRITEVNTRNGWDGFNGSRWFAFAAITDDAARQQGGAK